MELLLNNVNFLGESQDPQNSNDNKEGSSLEKLEKFIDGFQSSCLPLSDSSEAQTGVAEVQNRKSFASFPEQSSTNKSVAIHTDMKVKENGVIIDEPVTFDKTGKNILKIGNDLTQVSDHMALVDHIPEILGSPIDYSIQNEKNAIQNVSQAENIKPCEATRRDQTDQNYESPIRVSLFS
jgi:hypothetical protein